MDTFEYGEDEILKKYVILNVIICSFLQLLLFLFIHINNPHYLYDNNPIESKENLFLNPDAYHYYVMAKVLIEHKVFSRNLDAPKQHPDLHRTPTYPVFLAMLRLISSKLYLIYIAQGVLYLLSMIMIMYMTLMLTGSQRAAFIAGLCMSLNISAYAYVFMSMAEIYFNFLTVASMYFFCVLVKKYKTANWSSIVSIIFMTSFFTAVNVLARPATKLQIAIFILIVIFFLKTSIKKKFIYSTLLLVFYLILVFPWLIRNEKVFGTFEFSNSQAINLIFWAGSSGYAMEHNMGIYEAQDAVSREYNIPTYEQSLNPWQFGQNPTDNENRMKGVFNKILIKYPDKIILGALIGFVKCHLSHNNDLFGGQFGTTWTPPSLSNIAKGNFGVFFDKLSQNKDILIFLFLYQLIYLLLIYSVLGAGIVYVALHLTRNTLAINGLYCMLFLTLMYFYMMIAVVNLYSYARHRMMVELIYYIIAGHAVLFIQNRQARNKIQ